MKADVRYLGLDDSPFRFEQQRVRVVGVVTRGAAYVEGILSTHVEVDGTDATERLVSLITGSRFRPTLRVVLLNGVTVGGFNVVDLDRLHTETKIPVVSVVRDEPDLAASRAALRKHFADSDARARLLDRYAPSAVKNGRHVVWAAARGIPASELPRLLETSTVRGAIPEPLRLAHVIASGIERGESRGPA